MIAFRFMLGTAAHFLQGGSRAEIGVNRGLKSLPFSICVCCVFYGVRPHRRPLFFRVSCVPPVKKWVNSSITRLGAIAHRLNEAVRETFETLLLATHIAHGFSILDDLTQTESLRSTTCGMYRNSFVKGFFVVRTQ